MDESEEMNERFNRESDMLFIGIEELFKKVKPSAHAAMHVLMQRILKIINADVDDQNKHEALVEMYVYMKEQIKMEKVKHETQIRTLGQQSNR